MSGSSINCYFERPLLLDDTFDVCSGDAVNICLYEDIFMLSFMFIEKDS